MRKEPLVVSFAIHISVIGSLALLRFTGNAATKLTPPAYDITRLTLPPPPIRTLRAAVQRSSSSDAGGGNRSPLPPSKGVPPKAQTRIFIPPQVAAVERPKLVLQMGVEDAPKIQGPVGDPTGRPGAFSGGSGLQGFGGPGDFGFDHGPGGLGPQGTRALKPSKWPELLYKAEPEYSESARKVRQQGTVILAVDVGVDGRPHNIRILRGLGLGLDEKAMDAVANWRFRPALSNGRPVSAPITIEVNFRLL